MLALLTDDCVRVIDAGLVPPGTPRRIVGARAVTEETTLFADRIRASAPMLVDGRSLQVIAPGAHLMAIVAITIGGQRVAHIEISRARADAVYAMLPEPAGRPG